MTQIGNNHQLAINMAASVFSFAVSLCIKFLLTPYVVKHLGAEAYGFLGLSSDIISYTSLLTIALNSMAGRFITIEYTSGNIDKANRFFSSVFYSNIIVSATIMLVATACVIWLDNILIIPNHLVADVKLLFALLVLNNVFGLVFGTWGVATFIKNRLELSNIRNVIGNLLNAVALFLLFLVWPPHIWYVGVAGIIMTLYISVTNIKLSRKLTPDLIVSKNFFSFESIKEILSSGFWNVLNKLSDILGYGLDLLVANLFLGATYMGVFALTRNVPFLILSLFQLVASVFAPLFTQLYAQHNTLELSKELLKSIRILGFIPLTCLYIWGESFYSLWIPSEDAHLLQLLTILGTLDYVVSMPMESLWNIFTVTNKLKYSSLTLLGSCALIIISVLISMVITDSPYIRLIVLASSRSIVYFFRNVFFLPLYGAHCLSLPKMFFYKPMFKSIVCTILSLALVYFLSLIWTVNSWMDLVFSGILTIAICVSINTFLIFTKSDRVYFFDKLSQLKR